MNYIKNFFNWLTKSRTHRFTTKSDPKILNFSERFDAEINLILEQMRKTINNEYLSTNIDFALTYRGQCYQLKQLVDSRYKDICGLVDKKEKSQHRGKPE